MRCTGRGWPWLALMSGVVAGVCLGCDDATAPEPPSAVAEFNVTVTPDSATIIADSTIDLWVSVVDTAGRLRADIVVIWSSSNAGIAVVDEAGRVQGVTPGRATIEASAEGASDSAAITVLPAVAAIAISPGQWTLVPEGTVELTAILMDADGDTIEGRTVWWSSSDTTVATVDSTGRVSVVALGSATIAATREGVTGSLTIPVDFVSFTSVEAGGSHTCALDPAAAAYCWGTNSSGQLGNGSRVTTRTPVRVAGELAFDTLAAGFLHTCGLTGSGQAYCWGANDAGQLGSEAGGAFSLAPVPVAGGLRFASLTAGSFHTCGTTVDRAGYCWGWNASAQLGDGTLTNRGTPIRAGGPLEFASLSAGDYHTCGVGLNGTTYCWGDNDYGELGGGDVSAPVSTPVPVAAGVTFRSVTAGGHYTCALTADDSAYCWGRNDYGQLGRGWESTYELDVAPAATGYSFTDLAASVYHVCGVAPDGAGYCWGRKGVWYYTGLLGGDGGPYPPVRVAGGLDFHMISTGVLLTSCALATDGYVYCWGANQFSSLGTATDPPGYGWAQEPVRVAGQP